MFNFLVPKRWTDGDHGREIALRLAVIVENTKSDVWPAQKEEDAYWQVGRGNNWWLHVVGERTGPQGHEVCSVVRVTSRHERRPEIFRALRTVLCFSLNLDEDLNPETAPLVFE